MYTTTARYTSSVGAIHGGIVNQDEAEVVSPGLTNVFMVALIIIGSYRARYGLTLDSQVLEKPRKSCKVCQQ